MADDKRLIWGIMEKFVPLPRSFFWPSAELVARRLLGHFLVRQTLAGLGAAVIVETEAYLSEDPACHAAKGETPRNRVMWGEHGRAYVYLIYGVHFCVNAVCRPKGIAEAVLIRAVAPVAGERWMRERRPIANAKDLTNGPAKLCVAMGITREQDGTDLCDPGSSLVIARNRAARAFRELHGPIVARPRIGISKATDLPLRFLLSRSEFTSRK